MNQNSIFGVIALVQFIFHLHDDPIGSMGRTVYFYMKTHRNSTIHVGEYTVRPTDPMGMGGRLHFERGYL